MGRALKGRRDDVVLMGAGPNQRGNGRRWIVQAVEGSLRRLQTDWIDLYQVHCWDPETDVDETLGALTDLVRAGKIRAFGSSTFPIQMIVEAQWISERRVRERFVSEQPPYSRLMRGVEADVLPAYRDYGMGVVSWSPLAAGWLTGRYRRGQALPESSRAERRPQSYRLDEPANRRKLDAADALGVLAEEAGLGLIHLAIAFVLQHPAVTAAIIGRRTMEAAREPARRPRGATRRRRPGPHRPDRRAGHQPESAGRRLVQPRAQTHCPPSLTPPLYASFFMPSKKMVQNASVTSAAEVFFPGLNQRWVQLTMPNRALAASSGRTSFLKLPSSIACLINFT